MRTRWIPRSIITLVVAGLLPLAVAVDPASALVHTPSSVNIVTGVRQGDSGLDALDEDDERFFRVASAGRSVDKVRLIGKFTGIFEEHDALRLNLSVSATRQCLGTFEFFNFDTQTWVSKGEFIASDTEIDLAPTFLAGGFVSDGGVAKVRVTCTTGEGDFVLKLDQFTLTAVFS